jgi:hypothetical protein
VTSPTPGASWLRQALRTLWLIPLAAFGFLLAATPHPAVADGLPLPTITLPTVTVPSLPVTLPTVTLLPTTSAGTNTTTTAGTTSTTAGVTTTGGASTAPGSSSTPTSTTAESPTADTTAVAGARRLESGAVSIPVTSVTAPARLVVVVSVQPRRVLRAAQTIKARVEVRDTRGYVVRGAAVSIRSVPAGKLVPVRPKLSAVNGRVAFALRLHAGKVRPGTLVLRVRASNRATPTTARTRDIRLVVKAKR